jgi:hypothetical protein
MDTHEAASIVSFNDVISINNTTTSASASAPSSTIAPYATDLNGVNQPLNDLLKDVLWWSLGIMALVVLGFRIWQMVHAHIRHLVAMNNTKTQQNYWASHTGTWLPWFKKQVLYAPLWNKRHNREIKLSSAVNIGTLPSRLHFIMLSLYLCSNFAYCAIMDYRKLNHYSILAELRGRSGVLAVANMIPLIILAGRNNPLISLLRVSFDTYNLLHRWIGRMVVLESLIHTIAWLTVKLPATSWSGVYEAIKSDPFIMWGLVGTTAMFFLGTLSPGPVRHAFYETFLNIHIILAVIAILGIYIHIAVANLPQLIWVKAIMIIWGAERATRVYLMLSRSWSRKSGFAHATVETLPGDACRVTVHLPHQLTVKPGSHAYLRFKGLNVWESHPFSIAWTEDVPAAPTSPTLPTHNRQSQFLTSEKARLSALGNSAMLSSTTPRSQTKYTTNCSFIIHAQTGLTRRLFDAAKAVGPRPLILPTLLEGPYGGHTPLASYGTVVLFAGSSGITHQIPYLDSLIRSAAPSSSVSNPSPEIGSASGAIVATRKIVLIWIVRDLEHLEWVRPWMDAILSLPSRRQILTIKLFITRPRHPREIQSPSQTVQMFPGRPNVKALVQTEADNRAGAMCVGVCGPGGLGDNVREAVRGLDGQAVVDFWEESFTW